MMINDNVLLLVATAWPKK